MQDSIQINITMHMRSSSQTVDKIFHFFDHRSDRMTSKLPRQDLLCLCLQRQPLCPPAAWIGSDLDFIVFSSHPSPKSTNLLAGGAWTR